MNTKEQGQFSLVIFKTPRAKEYVGFCYELAIVLSNEDERILRKELLDAVKGYVEAIGSSNLSNKLLNKHRLLPEEYQSMYKYLERSIAKKRKTKHGLIISCSYDKVG